MDNTYCDDLFAPERLARRHDPSTSHAAAAAVEDNRSKHAHVHV